MDRVHAPSRGRASPLGRGGPKYLNNSLINISGYFIGFEAFSPFVGKHKTVKGSWQSGRGGAPFWVAASAEEIYSDINRLPWEVFFGLNWHGMRGRLGRTRGGGTGAQEVGLRGCKRGALNRQI